MAPKMKCDLFIGATVMLTLYIFGFILCEKLSAAVEENTIAGEQKYGFPDKPIQLVRPDPQHKRLVILKDNMKLLHRIDGPVATVAVVGKFHSGKSFLMNQLMGKSNGFGVGPSVRPETMGIWMWGKPMKMKLASGQTISVVFLDTEGFAANNVSENYDAKIFAVATLISSHLLYNSVKIIDQADIDYLELLARRTQLFALKSQMSRAKWTNEFIHDLLTFPPLIWVVQDFVQETVEGESPRDWLRRLMESHTRENEDYEISLLSIFKSVDCHTLFLPAVKKALLVDLSRASELDLTEEYRVERDELVDKLKRNVVPKVKNNKPVNGVEMAGLFEILVGAANEGSLAEVPRRWDVFVERLKQSASEDCLKFYETEMSVLDAKYNSGPVKMKDLEEFHKLTFGQSITLLQQLLHGLDDAVGEAKRKLTQQIGLFYERAKDLNEKKIKLRCSDLQSKMELKAEECLRSLKLPLASDALHKEIRSTIEKVSRTFVVELADLVDEAATKKYLAQLKASVENLGGAVEAQNLKAIEAVFQGVVDTAVEKFRVLTKNSGDMPRKMGLLGMTLKEGTVEATKVFETHCLQYREENLYNPFFAVFRSHVAEHSDKVHAENEQLVGNLAKKTVASLLQKFRENTDNSHIHLPVNNTELESRFQTELRKVLREYEDSVQEFNVYKTVEASLKNLKKRLVEICELRRKENVEAFTREVEKPLNTAKQIILLSADKYNTVFSLKTYMKTVSLLNLNEGNPKHWSRDLKLSIVEHYIQSDNELMNLIKEKEGLWSSIVGFFQWILWLLRLA